MCIICSPMQSSAYARQHTIFSAPACDGFALWQRHLPTIPHVRASSATARLSWALDSGRIHGRRRLHQEQVQLEQAGAARRQAVIRVNRLVSARRQKESAWLRGARPPSPLDPSGSSAHMGISYCLSLLRYPTLAHVLTNDVNPAIS